MNDPHHDRFRSWLTDGTVAELPRDVALHASACDDCLRLAAGLDALTAVNAGAAGAPPTLARPMRSPFIGTAIARTAAGIAAVGFVAVATAIGVGSLIPPDGGGLAEIEATPQSTPAEGVLGGVGGAPDATATGTGAPTASAPGSPSTTASPSASFSADSTASQPAGTSAAAQPTPGPVTPPFQTAAPTPRPTAVVIISPPPTSTPAPTAAPTTAPPTPSPSPTPSPTLTPTPTPTPSASPAPSATPSPTPTPS